MIESAFFDSNIFLYAYSLDPLDSLKGSVAIQLLGTCQPVISTQVLQVFISNALRKPRLGIDESIPFEPRKPLVHPSLSNFPASFPCNTQRQRFPLPPQLNPHKPVFPRVAASVPGQSVKAASRRK